MILLCHPREGWRRRLCIKAKVVTSLGRNPPRHLMRGSQECDHQTLSTSASINMAQFLFSAFRVNSLGFWLWYCAGIGNRPRKYLPMASVLPHHGALQVASLASSLNLYLYPNMYTLYSFKKSKINVFYELKWFPGSKVSDRFNWLRNHNQSVSMCNVQCSHHICMPVFAGSHVLDCTRHQLSLTVCRMCGVWVAALLRLAWSWHWAMGTRVCGHLPRGSSWSLNYKHVAILILY